MIEITIKGISSIFLAFFSAMAVTWYFIPRVIRAVNMHNLGDKPGKHKIHKHEVPTLGGVGIFAGFVFGFLMAVNDYLPGVSYITAAALMLFFVGITDDLLYLTPNKKLIAEMFSILIIVLFTDLRFTSLHGFLGVSSIPAWVSYLITIFIMVLIINAVNLIDGIDGLATAIGIIASVTFGIWFWMSGEFGYTIMAVALIGTLIIFLKYNFSKGPDKIFMGDSGSLVIGFILAVFAVHFNEINHTGKAFHQLYSSPSVSIAILIVPLFDTLRVIVLRLRNHQSPFVADNRHIHHLMLRAGFSHFQATLFISIFNIFCIVVAFLCDDMGILYLGLLLLILCFIFVGAVDYVARKKEKGKDKNKLTAEPAKLAETVKLTK
jgi:UDP-GlcNAc:undecaprenyl-phosphate/decaprenyl-phosphate GlcNAc-1-phosphate transferase